jgi:hypothetical protein
VAAIVEAHPVDHRLVFLQAEQARPGISGLRQGSERAHLRRAEAEREDPVEDFRILVEAGGEPDRVREVDAGDADREPGIGRGGIAERSVLQRADGEPVRPLRIELEDQRPEKRIERHSPAAMAVAGRLVKSHAKLLWVVDKHRQRDAR